MSGLGRYLSELLSRLDGEIGHAGGWGWPEMSASTSDLLPTYFTVDADLRHGAVASWELVLHREGPRVELSAGARPTLGSSALVNLVEGGKLDFLTERVRRATVEVPREGRAPATFRAGLCGLPPWADGHKRDLLTLRVTDVIDTGESTLLLGAMGSGKSTLLRVIAHRLATSRAKSMGDRLPLVLDLRQSAVPLLTEVSPAGHLPLHALVDLSGRHMNLPTSWLGEALEECLAGRSVLMVDGFDEVSVVLRRADAVRLEDHLVATLSKASAQGVQIIVASRPSAAPLEKFRGFVPIDMAPLSLNEAIQIASGGDLGAADPALVNALKQTPRTLRATPLFVSLIGSLAKQGVVAETSTSVNLLDEALREMLEGRLLRRAKVDRLQSLLRCDYDSLLRALEQTSYASLNYGGDAEVASKLSLRLGPFMELLHSQNEDVDVTHVVKAISQDAGLLWVSGSELHFTHRIFQEYLSALHIHRHSAGDRSHTMMLSSLIGSPESMKEVATLYAERLFADGQVNRLLDLCDAALKDAESSTKSQRGALQVWLASIALDMAEMLQGQFTRRDQVVVDAFRSVAGDYVGRVDLLRLADRVRIAECLGKWGDTRVGVGLRGDGCPDIQWVDVSGGSAFVGLGDRQSQLLRVRGESVVTRETPQCVLTLEDFRIAKYPITWAQFEAFLGDSAGYVNDDFWAALDAPDSDRERRCMELSSRAEVPNLPVTGVDWFEARAFTIWLGHVLGASIDLPTEEEWEWAARGTATKAFPWGTEFAGDSLNWGGSGIGRVIPVGCFDSVSSPWADGPADLLGNVWEWTLSVAGSVSDNEFARLGSAATQSEQPSLVRRIVRGGCYLNGEPLLRSTYRGNDAATSRFDRQGFRVIRRG